LRNKGPGVGLFEKSFADAGAQPVAGVGVGKQQDGQLAGRSGLQGCGHLARVGRVDSVVVVARDEEHGGIARARLDMLVRRVSEESEELVAILTVPYSVMLKDPFGSSFVAQHVIDADEGNDGAKQTAGAA